MVANSVIKTHVYEIGLIAGFFQRLRSRFQSGVSSGGDKVPEPAITGEEAGTQDASLDSGEETTFADPTMDRTLPKTSTNTDPATQNS